MLVRDLAGLTLIACALFCGGLPALAQDQDEDSAKAKKTETPAEVERNTKLRNRMVNQHLVERGIKNKRVLDAFRTVPRHKFLPPGTKRQAYDDESIPIGEGQTITPPYDVAFMTEVLDPKPTEVVYEVGTGSGYQSAILSQLVKEVYSVEIHKPLAERATKVHKELGYKNIHTRVGDGYEGWPEAAPFDAIIVTCAPTEDSPAARGPAQGWGAHGDSPGRPVHPERVAGYQEGRQADQARAETDVVRADDRTCLERGCREARR